MKAAGITTGRRETPVLPPVLRRIGAGPRGTVPRPRRRRDQGGTARRVHQDAPRPVLVGHRQPVADRRPADRAGPVLRRAFLPRSVAAPQTRPHRRHRDLHLRGHRIREIRHWPRRSSPGTRISGARSWCPATSEANGSPWCRPSTAPCCGWARGCRTGSTPWPCPSKPAGISRAAVVADRAHPLGGAAGRVDRNGAARQPGPDPDRDHRDRGGHHRGHQVLRGLREPGPARADPPAPHRRPAAEPHPGHGDRNPHDRRRSRRPAAGIRARAAEADPRLPAGPGRRPGGEPAGPDDRRRRWSTSPGCRPPTPRSPW